MPIWKQTLVALALLVTAALLWVVYVPAAGPALERYGLRGMVEGLGITVAAAPAPEQGGPGRQGGGPGGGGPGGGGATTVIARAPTEVAMNDVVEAIGTARAVRAVVIAPEVAGQITRIAVAPGQYVEAGDPIASLDQRAARIALDRATLTLSDARATADRLERLRGTATDLQRQDADLALRTAELELREAEFDLSRREIIAPIAGWVGFLAAEQGDQVEPGDALTQIEDRSSLIVEFRLPERVVGSIGAGDTVTAAALARPEETLTGTVTALDNRVDAVNRTLRVQAALGNPDDALRAGMAFSISVRLAGVPEPAVDPLAIQWSGEGAFVWVVRNGKSERLRATILQRGSDAVLLRAAFEPGDLVVIEGVQTLRPGGEVVVAGNTAAET